MIASTVGVARRRPSAIARLLARPAGRAAVAILLVYAVVALASACGAFDAWNLRVGPSFAPPGRDAWLGTDRLGRSVALQLANGARTSLGVVLGASLVSTVLGAGLGLLAGAGGRKLDATILWLATTQGSVPGILLLLGLAMLLRDATLFGVALHGTPAMVLALGLSSWVSTCRLVRAEVLRQRERDHVHAAIALGFPRSRVFLRHVLPGCTHLILLQLTLHAAGFVHAEVVLGYLGLGSTSEPSWGAMLDQARYDLAQGAWWTFMGAAGAVFLLSLSLNLLGESARDATDPTMSARGATRGLRLRAPWARS